MVSPNQFIPIAEETGLICPIGYFVLQAACRQWCAWSGLLGEDFNFIMNVNLSGRQLQRPDVVDQVTTILAETRMPPHFLKLEITESVIMENMEDVIVKLNQFRAMGIKLAIDDFGTGYSSMSSLSSFPVNTVKIDKAFVQQLGIQEEAHAVVAALIMLSKTPENGCHGGGHRAKRSTYSSANARLQYRSRLLFCASLHPSGVYRPARSWLALSVRDRRDSPQPYRATAGNVSACGESGVNTGSREQGTGDRGQDNSTIPLLISVLFSCSFVCFVDQCIGFCIVLLPTLYSLLSELSCSLSPVPYSPSFQWRRQ